MSEVKYELRRKKENAIIWIARRLPKQLKMRVYFDILAHATTGKYEKTIVPEITAMEAIDRYCKDNDL
jgi:hypothetical protein